jgi:hypothetical protein
MPTVHKFDGRRVFIPTNDHRPAHVHVVKAGNEAIFVLNCPDGPLAVRETYGFKSAEIGAIENELNPIVRTLCVRWELIHGQP